MGSKSDKLKEEALRKQNEEAARQFTQARADYQPSPYEQALNKEGMEWIDKTSGKEPLDITKLPGMAPYLDIFQNAAAKQGAQRFGLGTMAFGAANANPNLMGALAQQDESHRRQDAGAQLSNAFAIRNAEVRGTALPLIGIGENRNANKFGTAANVATNANNNWARFQVRPGFWATLMNNATQGMGQGVGAAAIGAA